MLFIFIEISSALNLLCVHVENKIPKKDFVRTLTQWTHYWSIVTCFFGAINKLAAIKNALHPYAVSFYERNKLSFKWLSLNTGANVWIQRKKNKSIPIFHLFLYKIAGQSILFGQIFQSGKFKWFSFLCERRKKYA